MIFKYKPHTGRRFITNIEDLPEGRLLRIIHWKNHGDNVLSEGCWGPTCTYRRDNNSMLCATIGNPDTHNIGMYLWDEADFKFEVLQ